MLRRARKVPKDFVRRAQGELFKSVRTLFEVLRVSFRSAQGELLNPRGQCAKCSGSLKVFPGIISSNRSSSESL